MMTKSAILLVTIIFLSFEIVVGQHFKLTDNTTYFPLELYKREFEGKNVLDTISLRYHSHYLTLFEEPILFNSNDNATIFRFTWIRSFDVPMVITLTENDDNVKLQTKYGKRIGIDNSYLDLDLNKEEIARFHEYANGKLDSSSVTDLLKKGILRKDTVKFRYVTQTKAITFQDYQKFIEMTELKNFWTYPTMERITFGDDGADWILEGLSQNNGYHMVYRWSPGKKKDYHFRQVCEYLISLTDIVRKKDVY